LNPFTVEYFNQELAFYCPKPYEKNGLKLELKLITGCARMDDFFSVRLVGPGDLTAIPILSLDGHLWMSITPMELQSAWVAIRRFSGHVVTAGLGMGYIALRLAAKEDITKVMVYERDERVVEFFLETQAGRPELDKIDIIQCEDARTAFKGVDCDWVFMDLYDTLLPNEAIEDVALFTGQNTIRQEYRFWGQEKALLELVRNQEVWPLIDDDEEDLIQYFMQSDGSRMYQVVYDTAYCESVAEQLQRI